jgi:hypothetical protein
MMDRACSMNGEMMHAYRILLGKRKKETTRENKR